MKNKLWIATIVLLLLPASVIAADKEHGGFMFRFIGAGGGGASLELNSSDGSVRERVSTLAHGYRFDFGYSFTQYFALHIGLWGRYIHDGQSRPLQQITGVPIGVTFFLPNNWYISPTFIYNVRRSDRGVIEGTIGTVASQYGQGVRNAALVGGPAGAAPATTTGVVTAVTTAGGTLTAQAAGPLVVGALTAGTALAVGGASAAQIQGAVQGALQQGGITDANQLTAATAVVTGSISGIVTAANTEAAQGQAAVYAANSRYVDNGGAATTTLGFSPRGYSYGIDIGWENPANDDWGVGFGLRYWRIHTESTLAVQVPNGVNAMNQPVFATRSINLRAREDLFGFILSATYN